MFEKRRNIYRVLAQHTRVGVQFDALFDVIPTCKELAGILRDNGMDWLEFATLAEKAQLVGWQKDAQAHSQTARAFNDLANAIDMLNIPFRACYSGPVPSLLGASLSIQRHSIYVEIDNV